jgi:protein-S-isoprenylcysteine O-methyltransferase Ste14
MTNRRGLAWPAALTLGFVLFIGPGPVLTLVPGFLAGWEVHDAPFGLEPIRWLGGALFVTGAPLLAESVIRFVRKGLGTPAPVLPPKRLVVTGFYPYVRNPMYLGILSMLLGEGLFLGSTAILAYAMALAFVFHLFVVLYEEPHLRRVFGSEYEEYCRRVRRWVPRLRSG